MRDRSKKLTVINTDKKKSEDQVQQTTSSTKPTTYQYSSVGFNGSDYLLKKIWDSVWEIKKDSNGSEYIFGKLPVVTQYGITMYAGDNVEVAGIYEGLPIDNSTIKWVNGVLTAVSTSEGSGLDESELAEYLTNNDYAKKSDITTALSGYATSTELAAVNTRINNFLEGSDTDGIINKWLELESFLSGLSQTDNLATILSNKIDRTEAEGLFVTIDTTQTVTGEKDFTGGLKVNGGTIYYDSDNKYWKLEGDLIVSGGVTMYASDTAFTPSTIMDALAVDGENLKVVDGILTFVGETGGTSYSSLGSLLNVDTSIDDTATVDRVLYQAAGSGTWTSKPLSEIGGSGTVSGDYLPLTGGTLTGSLLTRAVAPSADNTYSFGYSNYRWAAGHFAGLYVSGNSVWHSGNDGSGSGLDADLLDGCHAYYFYNIFTESISSDALSTFTKRNIGNIKVECSGYSAMLLNFPMFGAGSVSSLELYIPHYDFATYGLLARISVDSNRYTSWRTFAFTDSNVASATKLQTARTIWGQSFDGTGNITGNLTLNNCTIFGNNGINMLDTTGGWVMLGAGCNAKGWTTYINGYNINLRTGSDTQTSAMYINSSGYVGIGTTSPDSKLHVNGVGRFNGNLFCNYGLYVISDSSILPSLNVFETSTIGHHISYRTLETNKPLRFYYRNGTTYTSLMEINTSANLLVYGGITMYSDIRKKTKLRDVVLSLKEIADAPLIEHYYNSDEKKTTHVGSIAQYWAGLNDWFCKKDNDGYYTMEIQNAALASAISVARELVKYESKTDKKIRMLKKRISQLEDEIESLKKGE